MKIPEVESLMKLAREYGATEVACGDVSFKLAPVAPAAKASAITAPLCACGHALHDHTAEGCLHCGPDDKCLKSKGGRRGA